MKRETNSFLFHLCFFLMLAVLASIQVAALGLQFFAHETPCPLCLLQRVAMFGIAFALVRDIKENSLRNVGIGMIFALFLLIVSVRQVLLDIYPRPGHEYIGSAIFGLHMPVWSVLIAASVLAGYAFGFAIFGGQHTPLKKFPRLAQFANALAFFVVILCAINFGSVIVQCGIGECHTYEYRLLR